MSSPSTRRPPWQTHRRAILWGLGAAAVVAGLSNARLARSFEERALGAMLERFDRDAQPCPVLVVELHGKDFAHFKGKLSRVRLAQLAHALGKAGALSVGFDMSFAEPNPDGPEEDAKFEALLAATPGVVLGAPAFEDVSREDTPTQVTPLPLSPSRVLPVGPSPAYRVREFMPPYGKVGELGHLASFGLQPGASGLVRAIYPLVEANGQRLPTIALAMWLASNGIPWAELVQAERQLSARQLRLPLSETGAVPYRWQRDRYQRSSFVPLYAEVDEATATLHPRLEQRYRGLQVLIGTAWDVQGDVGPIATGERQPLVHAHAQLLCDLIAGRPMRDAPPWVSPAWALLSGLLLTMAAVGLTNARSLAALLAMAALVLGAVKVAIGQGWYLAPLAPLLGGSLAWAAATAGRLQARDREQRVLKDAFGAYVHKSMMDKILASPDELLALAGARKNVTVMFSDLVGFTVLTNQLQPEKLVTMLREYLEAMTDIIGNHGGRVDKIMGDGIMAAFGDPIDDPDHAAQAVRAALQMRVELARLNALWSQRGLKPLNCRIGISTGEVFVGNIGSRQSKLEYTALGVTVNLGSRLEGKAPTGCVLVSPATAEEAGPAFEVVESPPLSIKGFEGTQTAFLVLGLKSDAPPRRRHARFALERALKLEGPAGAADAHSVDVGPRGLRVRAAVDAPVGAAVTLAWAGVGPPFLAQVRWRAEEAPGHFLYGLEARDGQAHLDALFGAAARAATDSKARTP